MRNFGVLNPQRHIFITPTPSIVSYLCGKADRKILTNRGKITLMRENFPETTEKTHIQTQKEHDKTHRTWLKPEKQIQDG